MAPAPPPPPSGPQGMPGAFKIVPGLGDALHEAMKKISGVEEIAPAAEGVASAANKQTSTPTGQNRPKSWHGSQVPGKPKINKTLVSEMENRLAKRRNKVDQEAYVSEGPDPVLPPPEPVCLPPSGARKPSVASVDSGRGGSVESTSRNSLEPGGYARVSVDQERKEELMLAKAVRRSSAKMLGRDASPNSFTSPIESPPTVKQDVSPSSSLPPPSPVVMRYWKQCSSTTDSGFFDEEGMEHEEPARDANGEVIAPWKADAIEGDEQQFPSIAEKIKQMEEEAKKPKLAMYEVPDVKAKMNKIAPTAKWMEARGKLQNQLDTLITKTSEKMAKYGSIHARVKDDFVKDSSIESDGAGSMSSRPGTPKEVVDKQVKTLIKTVANEIQKSFSKKSIHALDDEEEKEESESEESEDETEEERQIREEAQRKREEERKRREERENARKAKRVIKEAKKRQKHIDVEAPILDFELKEPTPEPEPESEEEEDADAPVDFNTPTAAINHSSARSKIEMARAKKRAAERAKGPKHVDASTSTDSAFTEIELIVAEKLHRKEKFSDKVMQTQWEISNAEYEFSRLSDNEKAEMLTKQISKMKSKHVTNLLKSIDTGVLDISVPMLVPFLSLQARMSLGTDLHKNRFMREDAAGKNKMAKETFVDTMLKDITDIALLQEVIERSQEKLQILAAEDEKRFADKMRKQMVNIENDSFELGSSPPMRAASPIMAKSPTPVRSATPKKEISPEKQVARESVGKESGGETTSAVANKKLESKAEKTDDEVPFGISDVLSDEEEEEEEKEIITKEKSDAKKSDDEGLGSSESDDDKEEKVESKAEEPDEGLGKSDDKEEEVKVKEEAPKETNIKNKILNIIQDAKAMDQKRNIRNYGRNFEFQGVKEALKPVLPNDRRPMKAKRLDSMWMNVTAAKQRYNDPPAPSLEELKSRQKKAVPTLEELKNKPKANVPWTKKTNAQPVKKEILAEEKEVKEFESCRKTLKENVKSEAAEKDRRKIQTVKKKETTPPVAKEEKDASPPVSNEKKEKAESSPAPKEEKTFEVGEEKQIKKVEAEEIAKDSCKKLSDVEKAEKVSCSAEIAKTEAEETEVKVEESDSKVNLSEPETATLPAARRSTSPSNNQSADSKLPARRSASPTNISASESSSEVEWEASEDEEEVVSKKKSPGPVKEKSPSSNMSEPVIATKEIPSLLLMSPMVRRRGEEAPQSTSVSVSASIRLPPPPSFRPPPPPVSPPVPATKAKVLLTKEESSEEEEESEWEYETESEEE